VEQQPVVGIGDIVRRDMLDKRLFHLIRGVVAFRYESQSVGYAIDMGVDGKGRLPERHTLDHVGGLPPNAWQVE
jgi:hypothetical protein